MGVITARTRVCCDCGIEKPFIPSGKFGNGNRAVRRVDENGKVWIGARCSPCNVARAKVRADKNELKHWEQEIKKSLEARAAQKNEAAAKDLLVPGSVRAF